MYILFYKVILLNGRFNEMKYTITSSVYIILSLQKMTSIQQCLIHSVTKAQRALVFIHTF